MLHTDRFGSLKFCTTQPVRQLINVWLLCLWLIFPARAALDLLATKQSLLWEVNTLPTVCTSRRRRGGGRGMELGWFPGCRLGSCESVARNTQVLCLYIREGRLVAINSLYFPVVSQKSWRSVGIPRSFGLTMIVILGKENTKSLKHWLLALNFSVTHSFIPFIHSTSNT